MREPKIYFFVILEHVDGVHVEMSMNPNDPYSQALDICLFNLSNRTVCKSPSATIQHASKKTLTSWTQHDTVQETIAFVDKRKSLLVIQIQVALWRIN